MSEEVKKYYKKLKKVQTELDMQRAEQTEEILAIEELFDVIEKEHQITAEEPRETSAIKNQDTSGKTAQNDVDEYMQIKKLRETASIELKKYSAKSLTELEPSKNAHVEFKIELIDPNMKPIRCKVRPLPHNLKEKVKKHWKSKSEQA